MPNRHILAGPRFRYGAKVALAAVAAYGLTLGTRNDYALFSALGAAMVVGGSLGEDLSSSLNRVRGTLAGTVIGIASVWLLGSSAWSLALAVASLAWLTAGLGWGPAAMRVGIAMALVVLFTHTGDATHYALLRTANTLVGVVIGVAVGRLVWPIRGHERIAGGIERLLDAVAGTLEALSREIAPEALLARQVEVLDAMAALRAARKDARLERSVGAKPDLHSAETQLVARAAVLTLGASLRVSDLAVLPDCAGPLAAARDALAALATWARERMASPETALDEPISRAATAAAAPDVPAEARTTLAALLDELYQVRAALRGLRDAAPAPGAA